MTKMAAMKVIAAGLLVVAASWVAYETVALIRQGRASGSPAGPTDRTPERLGLGESRERGAGPASGLSPKLAWRFKTGGSVCCTPVIDGGRVYVGSGDGNVYALGLEDGGEIWFHKTGGPVDGGPLLFEGRLYAGSADATLHCLDANTGALRWKYATGDKIVGGPALLLAKGEAPRIVVGSYDTFLYCLDARSSRKLWTYASEYYINGSPVVWEGGVVFGGCDKYLHVVSADGNRLHAVDVGSYVIATVAVEGDTAYIGQHDGVVYAINVATGAVRWKKAQSDSPVQSSAAVDEKRVIFGSQDGNVYCLDRAGGRTLWNFPTGDAVNGSPTIDGNEVIVGSDDGKLHALRLQDGKEVWRYETGEAVQGKAAVAGDWVIFGCNDGYVYALKRGAASGAGGRKASP